MDVNLGAVAAATAVMFGIGGIWYMPLFGRLWGKIHGMNFEGMSKKQIAEARKGMGSLMGVQVLVTAISAFVLATLATKITDISVFALAFWVWLGFVLPAQISGILFGGDKKEYKITKAMIMTSEALIRLLVAAWVINLIQK
jgi:hypothetical protein